MSLGKLIPDGGLSRLQGSKRRRRLRVVTKWAGLNTRFRSNTDLGYTNANVASFIYEETVNRKVINMRPVWGNFWKEGAANFVNTNAESTAGLGTITLGYAIETPKTDYRTAASTMFQYSAITQNITSHENKGGGSGTDGQPGYLVLAPGQVAVGGQVAAADVAFTNGVSQTFPNHYSFFLRQHINVPSGEYPISRSSSWGAGSAERYQQSATSLAALLAGTGRFSASANSDLCTGAVMFRPLCWVGEVDDSQDDEPYLVVGFLGNSNFEGPASSDTFPQTGAGPDWASEAAKWRNDGFPDEWARSIDNKHGVFNLGCSSARLVQLFASANNRDAVLALCDYVDVVVVHFANNDYVAGQTFAQMTANTISLITELKRRGKIVVLCTGFPYGTATHPIYRQYTDWAAVASNSGADFVFNPLPDIGDDMGTYWRYKTGYSSDNVHVNNTTGLTALVASWNNFWNANKAYFWR